MKDQTLELYTSLIKTYRKLLNLYKEIGYLKLNNLEKDNEYQNKMEVLKQFVEYEEYIFSDKFHQLKELNDFTTSLSEHIEDIESCYLMESEEVLIYRIISKLGLASLNNISYDEELTLEERNAIAVANLNLDVASTINVFYTTILKEEIDKQNDLEIKKILNKMMFYEIFSNAYLENHLIINNFEIPSLDNAGYDILNSGVKDIEDYKINIASNMYKKNLCKLLELSDENFKIKEGEAIIIFLLSRIKANLVLLPDEIIEKLNYEYNSLIEELKIDNYKIQSMINGIYSDLRQSIKKYRRND